MESSGIWQRLLAEYRAYRDTGGFKDPLAAEYEQARIRIVIGILCTLYFAYMHFFSESAGTYTAALWIGSLFALIAVLLLLWAYGQKETNWTTRRYASILLDSTTVSVALILYGETAMPLFPVYLWVILGNGFRFGISWLALSAILGVAGFLLASQINPIFTEFPAIVPGLLLSLILIPVYVAVLLRKLNSIVRSADHANAAKSNFLANMSHELRTPLVSIVGGIECLANTPLNNEQRGLIDGMHTSSQTLLALISDILDLAKIEAHKLQLSDEDFDFHSLANDTVRVVSIEAKRKGVDLRCVIDPNLPFKLHGDPHHIRQVLLNLLGNAVKFTEQGHIEVRAIAKERVGDKLRLRLEIEDTGVGIPLEAQEDVFDSFKQADISTSRRFGGAGLGTTIAQHIVEAMGGTIGFESEPGKGTTFWYEVPLTTYADLPEHQQDLLDARVLMITTPGGDHQMILNALSDWKASVTVIDTPSGGVQFANESAANDMPFQVVIVNKSVLDANHEQIAQALRNLGATTRPTLIAIDLDHLSEQKKAELTEAGYQSILPTPLDKRALFNAIHASSTLDLPASVVNFALFNEAARAQPDAEILLVDDIPASLSITAEILRQGGYTVKAVDSAERALDELEGHQFDLVVTDLHMPEMDGARMMKLHRFMLPDHPVPFMFLTADATVETRKDVLDAGADAFLVKPAPAELILRNVNNVIATNRAAQKSTPNKS